MPPNKFGNHNIVREECQQKAGELKTSKSAIGGRLEKPWPL